MKYKFNPYERAVGLFLTVAIFGSLGVGVVVAVKKNWFEDIVAYSTYVESASNLREGSAVQMSGLKVGRISRIELDQTHNIKVTFEVLKKYQDHITEGTKVQFLRPFIIGDKVLTITRGTQGGKVLSPGEVLPQTESVDLFDVLTGSKAQSAIARLDNILDNLDKTMALGKDIAFQVGDKKKLQKTIDNITFATSEVRRVLPHLTAKAPAASEQLMKTIENLSSITAGLKELQPQGSQKTIELLNESVITLQAMQKSFFLRGNFEEVREEIAEKAKKEETSRLPAGAGK